MTSLIKASYWDKTEIVKILIKQEGIDLNAKTNVDFNHFIFQNNI